MEAQEVKDLNLNKSQQEINADVQTELSDRYTKEETYNREEIEELVEPTNYVSVVATNATTAVTDILPATGEANTIYRVGNWNGTQYDTTMYALYAWNGTTYVCLAVRSFVGEVYDISVNHPDGQGNPTPYVDLTEALGTSGANIPADIRRGGMSIKFIQGTVQSIDNKYVQARCMAQNFTTDVADWQGIDTELVPNSKNLVENGAVFAALNTAIYNDVTLENYIRGYIKGNGDIEDDPNLIIYYIPCAKGDKFKLSFQSFSSTLARAYAVYSAENIENIGSSNKIAIGPVGAAGVEYDIEITSADAKWLVVQERNSYNNPHYYGAVLDKLSYISKFTELVDDAKNQIISSKDWRVTGNVVYDNNEIPQEYDITWVDGVTGRVVCSNFNNIAFEYSTITATYGTKNIVYTLTYDSNGYLINETFNIQ